MYHKDLEIWKLAIQFVKKIYILTSTFPKEELFGLTAQIRRAAVSIPSNLAEGSARYSSKDTSRFLDIMLGSIAEVDTQLTIIGEIGLSETNTTEELIKELDRIKAMTVSLRNKLKSETT